MGNCCSYDIFPYTIRCKSENEFSHLLSIEDRIEISVKNIISLLNSNEKLVIQYGHTEKSLAIFLSTDFIQFFDYLENEDKYFHSFLEKFIINNIEKDIKVTNSLYILNIPKADISKFEYLLSSFIEKNNSI
jgi:hypothetical protein